MIGWSAMLEEIVPHVGHLLFAAQDEDGGVQIEDHRRGGFGFHTHDRKQLVVQVPKAGERCGAHAKEKTS